MRKDQNSYEYNTFVVVLRNAVGAASAISEEARIPIAAGPLLGFSPLPFQSRMEINYRLAEAGHVILSIYDSRGRLIRSLADEVEANGAHRVVWNGGDFNNRMVPSGVYLLRLSVSNRMIAARRLIVVR